MRADDETRGNDDGRQAGRQVVGARRLFRAYRSSIECVRSVRCDRRGQNYNTSRWKNTGIKWSRS